MLWAMVSQTRKRIGLVVLVLTWAAIAAVIVAQVRDRRAAASAKAELEAREAEFMAKMDRIAAEEARKRAAEERDRPAPAEVPDPDAQPGTAPAAPPTPAP